MPLFIVMNARSGARDFEECRRSIASVFERAGQAHEFLLIHHPKEIVSVVERAAELGKTRNGAVIASGGDGTINALAQRVLPTLRPFGILPNGTFNYFARVHDIPLDLEAAAQVLLDGRITPVQVGAVNDRIFLVNASLGLHPQMLQDREQYTQRYGRHRFIAMLAGLRTVFRERAQLSIRIEHDREVENVRTPSLFISNNSLQLEQVGLPEADAVDNWKLAAITMKPVGSMALLKLALQGALGRLGEAENVRSFEFKRMTVAPRSFYGGQRMQVATDGERAWMRAPLNFSLTPQPLMLIKPDASAT
ncbi:MAG: diacylglycerol kinase family protein [Steroidobacteraceae bacterium]